MTDVTITYIYDLPLFQQTWRAARANMWRRPFGRFVKYVMAPLAVILAIVIAVLWREYQVLIFVIVYLLLTLALPEINTRFILPRRFRKMPIADKSITVRFTDEAVESKSPSGNCSYRWEVFREIRETPRHFVFGFHNGLVWLAPKEAFASQDGMRAVRDLARRKIKPA